MPLNLIDTIQALVLYNRTGDFNNTTIGLAIELYNSTKDPTLTEILATTSVITTAVDIVIGLTFQILLLILFFQQVKV